MKERVESLPGFSLLHDMVITKDYYVFFQAPISINPLRWLLGLAGVASCIQFEESKPAVAYLIPRNDASRPRVDINVDPHFSFHFVRGARACCRRCRCGCCCRGWAKTGGNGRTASATRLQCMSQRACQ